MRLHRLGMKARRGNRLRFERVRLPPQFRQRVDDEAREEYLLRKRHDRFADADLVDGCAADADRRAQCVGGDLGRIERGSDETSGA